MTDLETMTDQLIKYELEYLYEFMFCLDIEIDNRKETGETGFLPNTKTSTLKRKFKAADKRAEDLAHEMRTRGSYDY